MITWPAIIKYSGDAELAYIENQAAWDADAHLHGYRYEKTDVLIDSDGAIYTLSESRMAWCCPNRRESLRVWKK